MKVWCYLIFIVAFLMYYQQNSLATLVIILLVGATYLLFKLKKTKQGIGGFRRGFFASGPSDSLGILANSQDLNTFIALSQYLDSDLEDSYRDLSSKEFQEGLDTIKDELISLLED
ncbi:MAG: hypothetical protein ACTSR8_14075 [Promethearchaeota archaeon]